MDLSIGQDMYPVGGQIVSLKIAYETFAGRKDGARLQATVMTYKPFFYFRQKLSFNILLCFYNCSALKILSYQKTFKAQKKNIGRLMPGFFFSFFSSMLKRLLLFVYQMSVLLTLLFFLANKILFIFFCFSIRYFLR